MRLGMLLQYSGAPNSLAMDEVLEAERLGYDSVWSGEAYGTDAVTPTAWILARTTQDQGRHRHHADAGAHAGLHGDDGDDPAGAVEQPLPPAASAPPGRRSSRAGTACRSASRWRARANTSRSCARS